MKAVLFIKPRKGKPHRAEDLSALGFRPAFTPTGIAFAVEVFPRKVDASLRMLDIARQHGIPCRRNAPLIWADDIRIELHSGKKAADLIRLYEWLLPSAVHHSEQPLITKPFHGDSAPL